LDYIFISRQALGIITIPKQIDTPAVVSGANRFDRSCVGKSPSSTLWPGLFGDLDPSLSDLRHLLEAFSKSSLFKESEYQYTSLTASSVTYGPSKFTIGSTVSLGFFRGLSVEASRSLVLLRELIGTNNRERMMHHGIDVIQPSEKAWNEAGKEEDQLLAPCRDNEA
jgi:hypothetical protein